MVVGVFPEPDQLLLVYLRFTTKFGQGAHFLLNSREEHVGEDLGYLEHVSADRLKLIHTKALPRHLPKNLVNTFVELGNFCLLDWFALWVKELGHLLLAGWRLFLCILIAITIIGRMLATYRLLTRLPIVAKFGTTNRLGCLTDLHLLLGRLLQACF